MAKKKPDPKKHTDIRIPDEDIVRDKDVHTFNEALKRVTDSKEDDSRPKKPLRSNKGQ